MRALPRLQSLSTRAVERLGARSNAIDDALADLLHAPRTAPCRVFVFAETGTQKSVRDWIAKFPGGNVVVVSEQDRSTGGIGHAAWQLPASTLVERTRQLELFGPADVIVDLLGHDADDQVELWHHAFLHLRANGLYVVDVSASPAAVLGAGWSGRLALLLGGDVTSAAMSKRDLELRASTAAMAVSRSAIAIRKQQRHYLKLRDDEAEAVLATREPALRVRELASMPAGVLTNHGTTTSHTAGVDITALAQTLPYPALHLRHYRGHVSVLSNALVVAGDTILPDSFRHHLEREPHNVRVTSASARIGRIASNLAPQRHLDGVYYHLDAENSGHYGHLMTEVISRLWGWDAAKRAEPDLKALFRIRYPGERYPALERTIFTAYGIDPDDIVWSGVPVSVDSLFAATPMWHNQVPHYVHPRIADVWRRLTAGLDEANAPVHDRIFVSRSDSDGSRTCRNIREVEDWFRERGFAIVYPGELELSMQAGVFGNARVVAGFGGSGMFNVLFSRRLETMIVLNHEAYTARNEHLFASVLGVDTHYFWSTPDVAQPPDGWSSKAYYSGWAFDFARNGNDLQRVVEQV